VHKRVVFRSRALPYLLVAPQMIITLVFFIWPAGQAILQSLLLQDAFGLSTRFVGLENFERLFGDAYYLQAFRVTVIFSVTTAALALGAALLLAVWPSAPADLGTTLPSVSDGSALVYEAVLTAFLMFTIMAVATDTRAVGAGAAIAIGGTVGLDALFGGAITGASMNPARSIGPALVSGELHDLWIYILAPIAGAAAGALAYQLVRGTPTPGRRAENRAMSAEIGPSAEVEEVG